MRKRVLLVDADATRLAAHQALLEPLREEWDIQGATSGPAALMALAQAQYDVVITTLSLPGLTGADLLERLKEFYPGTVRLVLATLDERDSVNRSIDAAHRFLPCPCDSATLRAALHRAGSPGHPLRHARLREVVSSLERLPSLPALYVELTQVLRSPGTSLEEVGEVVSRDPAMTAKVLQLANSAYFGLRREVSSAAEAAAYLGTEVLKELVLSLDVFGQFDSRSLNGISVEALWHHSLQVATVARRLVRREGLGMQAEEQSFVAGLMHDIGKLILAANFPSSFRQTVQGANTRDVEHWRIEGEVFAATHAEVGGYLLGLWGLPSAVVDAISSHHTPSEDTTEGFGVTTAIHVANALSDPRIQVTTGMARRSLDHGYLADRGLEARLPEWRGIVEEMLGMAANPRGTGAENTGPRGPHLANA